MKKIKALIVLVIIMTIFTSMPVSAAGKRTPHNKVTGKTPKITVTVNNKKVKYDVSPYLLKDEVMIPLKQTAEALGEKVTWNKNTKTAWLSIDMMKLELVVGKSELYIYRDADFTGKPETVKLQAPIKRVRGSVCVPGKIVFESIGAKVSWDSKKKALAITRNNTQGKDITYTEITKEAISKNKTVLNWYNANYKKAGVSFKKSNNTIYVLIAAGKKPTGGYTMGVDKITYEASKKAFVLAYVKAPSSDMMVTQAETYPHILIKLDGKSIKNVSGEVKEIKAGSLPTDIAYDEITVDSIKNSSALMKWYDSNNQKMGIHYMREGKYIYALIAGGERPTGGFGISIDKIYYSTSEIVSINATVTPPGDNVRVMMVITYPSKLIRIQSDTIKYIIGEVKNADNSKEKWPLIDAAKVSKIELLTLDQVKLRDITCKEKEAILQAFNEATIDPNFYIEMITGNILRVITTDGYTITFTSYGSETNVIANIAWNTDVRTFHLVAPAIAKLLLQK